jgi:hypothetical protein
LAAAVAGLAVTGVTGVAGAKDAGATLTLSARDYHYRYHHDHHWNYGRHRGWWNHYAGCRVVVRSHINRWGHRVVVRKRICY